MFCIFPIASTRQTSFLLYVDENFWEQNWHNSDVGLFESTASRTLGVHLGSVIVRVGDSDDHHNSAETNEMLDALQTAYALVGQLQKAVNRLEQHAVADVTAVTTTEGSRSNSPTRHRLLLLGVRVAVHAAYKALSAAHAIVVSCVGASGVASLSLRLVDTAQRQLALIDLAEMAAAVSEAAEEDGQSHPLIGLVVDADIAVR